MIVIIGVLGLIIGSFLNVVIYRVPKGESVVAPPSHCGSCGKRLGPLDLVPVISYIALGGRCRYCGEGISIRYPLVEAVTALLFLSGYYFFGASWQILFYFVYVSLLVAIALIDLDHQIIPDGLVLFGFGVAVSEKVITALFWGNNLRIMDALWGLLAGGGIFLLIAVLSRGGMGGGDVKLMGLLGFAFGLRSVLVISILAFMLGALISVFLLVSGLRSRKDPIPFGPFIALSTWLAMLFEAQIVHWYITYLIF